MFESHRVLHRYIIREYLKIFALSLSSLMLIYIVVLFFLKMSLFNRHQAPFYLMFEYLLYKVPEATFQWTIPYAALLSTLLLNQAG
jgi:lipopolysaccharide export LptBFGC system permease protein LptF